MARKNYYQARNERSLRDYGVSYNVQRRLMERIDKLNSTFDRQEMKNFLKQNRGNPMAVAGASSLITANAKAHAMGRGGGSYLDEWVSDWGDDFDYDDSLVEHYH